MASGPGRFALVGLIALVCVGSAFGGHYADPSGFSLDYPDGWIPITRDSMEKGSRALPAELKAWVSKHNVDLNRIAVMVVRDGRDDFLESINVIVDNEQVPLNDGAAQNLAGQFRKRYEAMDMKVDNLEGRVQRVGLRTAVVLEGRLQMPGVPHILRQKQVLFPGGGKTYIVTCTAKVGTFDKYQPAFDRMLASVEVPPPTASRLDGNSALSSAVMCGVLGGIGGGLVGLVCWFNKKLSGPAGPQRGYPPVERG